MRLYEVGVIVHPEVEEEQAAIDAVKAFITENGGEIHKTVLWGRRKLAYPIKKVTEGIYAFFDASMPADLPAKLERWFKFNEQILRYLVLRKGGE